MRFVFLAIFFCLMGCRASVPSEEITKSTTNDIKAISTAISDLDKTISSECRTQALEVGLSGIKTQLNGVSKQIENISLSCQTEKEVLEQQITVRNTIIVLLGVILAFLIYLRIKLK